MERRNFLQWSTAAGAGALAGQGARAAGEPGARAAGAHAAGRERHDGPLRVHIVLFDGAEELDFAAPFGVLSGAGAIRGAPGAEVRYVTLGRPRLIRGAYGSLTRVEHRWAPREADIIVVPGGGYRDREGPGIWAEIENGALPAALAAAPRPGLTLAAVCTGALLLGAAGLIEGRPCTTHHRAVADLVEQGGTLVDARVVDDGDLVTAGGVTSGLDLALWLSRRALGADVAVRVEAMLEYEARGTVWTPPGT
ncbi:DJ-1/PfpI family protein [Streptomyces marincola]|uniref:DJ-1/PfpI family protein n=1 Tax=Streptomyces marincola TaxID=2878388 RepID=UPI001CF4B58D|nr:DJ-1/PfpI family protein [Streptomyces marincola]UCM86738.1 DJ-1/PfpI family protein [Streptomyces marincola]